jgi:hypothetical protein
MSLAPPGNRARGRAAAKSARRSEQRVRGKRAERDDDLRRMMSICRNRNGSHVRHFVGLRIAVARRPALDHVGDVDIARGEANRLDDLA